MQDFESLRDEALSKVGTEGGQEARAKYDILKADYERKRNTYLFWNTIILSVIAVTNLIVQLVKLARGVE